MNAQRENVNPSEPKTNENGHLASLKPLGLTSFHKGGLSSQLKPLTDPLQASRKIFSDKSNKSTFIGKSTKSTKVYVDNQTTSKVATTATAATITTTTTATVKNEDTLQQSLLKELLKDHQDFVDDNKSRYKEESNEFEIVPVLPIVVPKHMRHLFEKNNTSYRVGSKRPFPTTTDSQQPHVDKKQKSMNYMDTIFVDNAPPIKIDINEESKAYEKQQETRAKLAMLQTTQSLKEHQWNDPMIVAEYAGEIFGYLYDTELQVMGDPTYAMNLQHEVTWRMRGVLVDWVIEIHYIFQLLPETLFLSVNIIDRFLSLRTVALGKLQLVGITALYIATKFEETQCPNIQDFLFMTDTAVVEDELIKAERFMLQVLDFNLCIPNPVNFFRRVCNDELKCDVHTRTLAKYFMEIACVDHTFIGVRPSEVAAASLWLSRKMLAKGRWNNSFTKIAGYTPDELKSTVTAMLNFLSQAVTHDAFFKKWSSKKLSKASIFVRDWINRYYIN